MGAETIMKFLVAILLVSVFFVGGFTALGNIADTYEVDTSDIDSETYDNINYLVNISKEMADGTQQDINKTQGDLEQSFFSRSASALNYAWDSYSVVNEIMASVADEIGIPDWIISAITAIIFFVISVSFIIFLRRS